MWVQVNDPLPQEKPEADSQVKDEPENKFQQPERDQPQIYHEEIVLSSPSLAIDQKPAEPLQPAIAIPERVQPAESVAAAAPDAVEALPVPAQSPLSAEDHIKDASAHPDKKDDCKIEYVLVEDKPAAAAVADDHQVVGIEPEMNPPAARFESRLNSRGKINASRRV